MEIKRVGSQPSGKGPAEWFTGMVRIDPLFQAPNPALVQGASVTFEPGARTAWHTHPLGQILIVTAGCGWVQGEGGAIEDVRPGDVVWFSPGEKHWHGATATMAMTHVAKAWGLVGCASFLVMEDQGISQAFTNDRHFEQAGIQASTGARSLSQGVSALSSMTTAAAELSSRKSLAARGSWRRGIQVLAEGDGGLTASDLAGGAQGATRSPLADVTKDGDRAAGAAAGGA